MKIVKGPEGEVGRQWDLARFGKTKVFLGSGPVCQIRLARPGEVPLKAGYFAARRGATGVEVAFFPLDGSFTVNGKPCRGERALEDGDLITLGPYSFRYKNLRRKATRRVWKRSEELRVRS